MSRRVRLIATGGTISSTAPAPGAGVEPALTAAELLAGLGPAAPALEIAEEDLPPVASPAMDVEAMLRVARAVERSRRQGFAGALVSHGTGTVEETAYLLALTLPRAAPVALTGAMRDPGQPGGDGPANLLGALAAAAEETVSALGPVVVIGDEIHAARWVAKVHSSRVGAFASPGAGPLGEIVEGRCRVWFRPAYEDFVGMPAEGAQLPEVALVKAVSGDDGATLAAVLAAGVAAVVIEGIGAGTVPPGLLPAIDAALGDGVPVVVASRCSAGGNFERTYSMPGSESDLARRGALFAGVLSGVKARLRLLIALALGLEPASVFPADRR